MYFSKMRVKQFYVICETYYRETEEVKTIEGELGKLLSDKDIVELQETLSDMSSEEYGGDDSSLEQDCYRQISFALESLLNDGNEFQEIYIFRSISDYYNDSEPLYSAFIPYEATEPIDPEKEKEREMAWKQAEIKRQQDMRERVKRSAEKIRKQKERQELDK